MKAAVLIAGHPKSYPDCWNSFNTNINIPHETYAHIWWDNSYRNKCYKMHFREVLDDADLGQELIKNFNINSYLIEKEKTFDLSFCNGFIRDTWGYELPLNFYRMMTPIMLYSVLCQTYGVLQAFLLSENNSFDVVIKARSDILFTKPLNNIVSSLDYSTNKIYFQSSMDGGHRYSGEHPNRPCDWFFVASKIVAKKFLTNWHGLIKEKYTKGIIHTNEFVKIVCKDSGIDLNLVDFGAIIYKQTNNYYDMYLNKTEALLNDFDFEQSIPKTESFWPYWIKEVDFKHFKNINF